VTDGDERREEMGVQAQGLTPLIQVFDMNEAIHFYCGVLGFELASASPEVDAPEGRHVDWAWLRLGGADLMLNTAYDAGARPPARDATRIAAHRDTGLFIACPDVDAAHAHLAAQGLDVRPPKVAPYGMKQLYLTDPDGYEICLQQPA
jgi:uncharacterized glyoxalase superfamily protein PhnB